MCRNREQGGRRCPHDDSTARRLRRANAKLKTAYAGEVHEPIHSGRVNQENLVPQNVQPIITIAQIKEAVDSYSILKNLMWEADGSVKSFPADMPLELDGVTYDSIPQMRAALRSKLEQETIRIGGMLALAASQKTGITDEQIIEGNAKAVEEATADYDNSVKDYENFGKNMSAKYSTSVMDVTYHISNKIEMEKRKMAEAAANGEEYTPLYSIEEMESDYKYGHELMNAKSKTAENLRNVKSEGEKEAREKVAANRAAQLELLKEIRNLGGVPTVHPKSNPQKVKVLQEALGFVPTEWIERSNLTGGDLMVKKTKARAHYSDGSYQKEYKVVKAGRIRVMKDGEEPKNTRWESGWIKVEADEDGLAKYVDAAGVTHERWIEPNETAYYAPDWEYARSYYDYQDPTKKPQGRGWEQATIMDSEYNHETKEHTYSEKTVWRRQVTKRNLVSMTKTAELLIDGDGKYRSGLDTAVHEFMHRVEAKDPRIGMLEEEFIRRRTTKEDGAQEGMIRIYKGKNEFSRPDNFIDNYMGKHYDHSSGKHWEVLSTGAEALWTGAFGGFMGIGNRKADTEHRNFILGIFATV